MLCTNTSKKGGATFTGAHQKEDWMIKFYLITVSIAPQSQHLLHFIYGVQGTNFGAFHLAWVHHPVSIYQILKLIVAFLWRQSYSRRYCTARAYSTTWKQESNWWDQRKMYLYFSIVASVADYFTGLGNKGHRSVILAFHTPTGAGAAWVDMQGGRCLFHSQSHYTLITTQVYGDLRCW